MPCGPFSKQRTGRQAVGQHPSPLSLRTATPHAQAPPQGGASLLTCKLSRQSPLSVLSVWGGQDSSMPYTMPACLPPGQASLPSSSLPSLLPLCLLQASREAGLVVVGACLVACLGFSFFCLRQAGEHILLLRTDTFRAALYVLPLLRACRRCARLLNLLPRHVSFLDRRDGRRTTCALAHARV